MPTRCRTSCLVLLLLVSVLACGGPRQSRSARGFSGLPGNNAGAGIVLSGPDLREHRGSLLAFLYGRISGMVVDFRAQPCPSVELRGRKSIFGSNSPLVYVDGVRTANSCILEMLSTDDLSRVEVYPMGVTHRPGYDGSPNGLILVFVRDGSDGAPGTPVASS